MNTQKTAIRCLACGSLMLRLPNMDVSSPFFDGPLILTAWICLALTNQGHPCGESHAVVA